MSVDWIEDLKKEVVPLRAIINTKIRKWALDHKVPYASGYYLAYSQFSRITGINLPGTKNIDYIEKLGMLGRLLDVVSDLPDK